MYADKTVKTKEIDIATTTIPLIPVPAQIIIIGARAVLGNAFNTTKKGSRILASDLLSHKIIAIINPSIVPINKPRTVSKIEIPISFHIDPFEKYSTNSFKISLGLLTKKTFNILRLTNISQRARILTNKSS